MTNLLPLETWRSILGFHVFHFWQLANSSVPLTAQCSDLLHQYAWQDADAAGRAEITEAIETAETRLKDYLGYWPAPKYREETVDWPQYYQPGLYNYGRGQIDGRWLGVPLSSGYIQAVGVEDLNVISASACP